MIIIVILVFLLLLYILGKIFGKYLYFLVMKKPSKYEAKVFDILAVDFPTMSAKKYFLNLLIFNFVVAIIAIITIYFVQNTPLLDPNEASNISLGMIVNVVASYLTNTNFLIINPETYFSYFTNTFVLTTLMFVASATGISACFAFLRGITNNLEDGKLGNFFFDFYKILVYFLIPLCFIGSLIFVILGVVQNFEANIVYDSISGTKEIINQGPIASFESIKLLGTNGGSFLAPNSISPIENPSILTNFIQTIYMCIIPVALVFTFGNMLNNKKQSIVLYVALMVLFLIGFTLIVYSMLQVNVSEVDLYPYFSALFMNTTTAMSTGAIDTLVENVGPFGIFAMMFNMLTSVVFGGVGVGLMNIVMYMILTIFLVGLMVGHSPEFDEKRIEIREVRYLAVALFVQSMIILVSVAITSMVLNQVSSGEFTAIFYNLTSASANNGSSMQMDMNSNYYIVLTTILYVIGRYLSMFLLLVVAYSMGVKHKTLEGKSAFQTDNTIFAILFIVMVIIISLLTFVPILILGPLSTLF